VNKKRDAANILNATLINAKKVAANKGKTASDASLALKTALLAESQGNAKEDASTNKAKLNQVSVNSGLTIARKTALTAKAAAVKASVKATGIANAANVKSTAAQNAFNLAKSALAGLKAKKIVDDAAAQKSKAACIQAHAIYRKSGQADSAAGFVH